MNVSCERKIKQTKFRADGKKGLLTLHDNGTVAVSQDHKSIFVGLNYIDTGSYFEIRQPPTAVMTTNLDRLFNRKA